METATDSDAAPRSPLVRLIKAKLLNIVAIVVLIVCLILFMRGGEPDEGEQVVKNAGAPQEERAQLQVIQQGQRRPIRRRKFEMTTTPFEYEPTTPFFTTLPARIHLKSDGLKKTIHADLLRVSGFMVGKIQLDHLDNYRNPCFFEERQVTNVIIAGITYRNNPFRLKDPFASKFNNLRRMLVHSHDDLCGDTAGCRLRCLPYFMVIGVAQTETIEFYDLLSKHPQIVTPLLQQLSFWNKHRFIDATFNDYIDLYDNATNKIHTKVINDSNSNEHIYPSITGEAESITIMEDSNWRKDDRNEGFAEPERLLVHDLHNLIPSLKFIILMRDPVSHIYWHYNNAPYGKDGKSPEEFHSRVKNSIDWWTNCTGSNPVRACVYGSPPNMEEFESRDDNPWWPKTKNFLGALRDGLYYVYIKDYLTVYPQESIKFVRVEDYLNDPGSYLNEQIYSFLNLPAYKDIEVEAQAVKQRNANVQPYYKPMLPESHELLQKFYKPYNEMLASLLNDKKYLWEDINEKVYRPNFE